MEACGKIFLREEKFFSRGCARGLAVTLHRQSAKRRPAGQGIKIKIFMKTQNSARSTKGANTETKNAVKNNAANSTSRVVVTRDEYAVVFDHAVALVVAYASGQKPEKPREGFAFGPIANGNHTRGYAKSLIWGFVTNKAGKVLKDFDDLAKRESREKIAIAILADCSLVKGDSEAIGKSLAKVEPKRERVFAESVLSGLKAAAEKPATTKGGKAKTEDTKATAPKGGKAKGESKPKAKSTTKGGRKSSTKQAAK